MRPLLRVGGTCHGVGLALESDQVPFGPVVLHSQLVKRLVLQNVGDIPCRYRFDSAKFAPDFSIHPVDGIVQPLDSVNLDVTFHPAALNVDIRYARLPCVVDGAETLFLTLTGACMPPPVDEAKEVCFHT